MFGNFFDELNKIALAEIKSKAIKIRPPKSLESKVFDVLKKDIPETKWGQRIQKLRDFFQKNGSYVDDLEAPPAQSLMPAIRSIHGLGKRSSWMDIGPIGQREDKAWRPIDPPFKLASGEQDAKANSNLRYEIDSPEPRAISQAATRVLGHKPYSTKNPDKNTYLVDPESGVSKTINQWSQELAGRIRGSLKKSASSPQSSFFDELDKISYRLQGHTDFQGLRISIENRKGDVRRGTDSDGNEWETHMRLPYGYFTGTRGADGEPVDVYVGPNKDAPEAFVVHQRDKETGKYDEDKVFVGMKSRADTVKSFLDHYDSPKFLGPISRIPIDRLREIIKERKGKKIQKITK